MVSVSSTSSAAESASASASASTSVFASGSIGVPGENGAEDQIAIQVEPEALDSLVPLTEEQFDYLNITANNRREYSALVKLQKDFVTASLQPLEKPETTHNSIVDHDGNAVSTTYTVNGRFGAVVIAPGTGFFLNDEMDDFTVKVGEQNLYGLVQGATNSIAPGKRPLSSMSPTLVTKDGKTFMVLGSPGGSRIITITLQTALNVIDHGMAPQEAVDAPRIHHQWLPDEVYYEQRGVSADSLNLLKTMGYKMVEQNPWGAAELILVGLAGVEGVSPANSGNDSAVSGKVREGYLYGANDVRRPAGAAIGY